MCKCLVAISWYFFWNNTALHRWFWWPIWDGRYHSEDLLFGFTASVFDTLPGESRNWRTLKTILFPQMQLCSVQYQYQHPVFHRQIKYDIAHQNALHCKFISVLSIHITHHRRMEAYILCKAFRPGCIPLKKETSRTLQPQSCKVLRCILYFTQLFQLLIVIKKDVCQTMLIC